MDRLAAQRRKAAERGLEVRRRRATVKRAIAEGDVDLAVVLAPTSSTSTLAFPVEEAAIAEEIRVGELLRSVPGIGRQTAGEILRDLDLPGDVPLEQLDADSRRVLAKAIEGS